MPDLLALPSRMTFFFFFLNDPAPTKISPLPLPAALPICVVPVDEDPRRVGADGIGDPIEQDRDLGLPDADDVDAAERGPQAVLLQRDRRGLEPVPAVARRVVGLADEAHERQVEGRLERESRRADEDFAAGHVPRSATRTAARDGCSSGVT